MTAPTTAQSDLAREGEFARFVARVSRAHAFFFALRGEEIQALPQKAQRGLITLQRALDDLRGKSEETGEHLPIWLAHRPDPAAFVEADSLAE